MRDSQLSKLKSGIKNATKVTLEHLSNVLRDSDDFPHKLLLASTQVSKISRANIKLSKTKLHKIGQSGEFLGHLGPLLKTGLSLIGKVFRPLARSVLILLGSETDQHQKQMELLMKEYLDQVWHH